MENGRLWTRSTVDPTHVHNNRTMEFIDGLVIGGTDDDSNNLNNKSKNNLMYVNWGRAVQPRSFGDDNIPGDLVPHYGKCVCVCEKALTFLSCFGRCLVCVPFSLDLLLYTFLLLNVHLQASQHVWWPSK
jgi:hypothetical protein